jgi:tetratricopeptide (TPR) repeat protein
VQVQEEQMTGKKDILNQVNSHLISNPIKSIELIESNQLTGEVSCLYVNLLRQNSNKREILRKIEAMKTTNENLLPCVLFEQHNALTNLSYYADAYIESKSFVRMFPLDFRAHLAMGESLQKLDRSSEAAGAIQAAYSAMVAFVAKPATLHSPDYPWSQRMDKLEEVGLVSRLALKLLVLGFKEKALNAFSIAFNQLNDSEATHFCQWWGVYGSLMLELSDPSASYLSMLHCMRSCAAATECELYLGKLANMLKLYECQLT